MNFELHNGDCLDILRGLPDCSVDAIVTDPPYGLAFMGKRWDYDVPSVEVWAECLRVLKPGGHLLAFAGTRTQHRMAVRIEDGGFEIRDMIAWVYGSGFPKSHDVSKAIDKAAGAEREVVGRNKFAHLNGKENATCYGTASRPNETAPATEAARAWQGWGAALKPALEPITVARKPLSGTVAANVLAHGTGALNIDGGRVATDEIAKHRQDERSTADGWGMSGGGTGSGATNPAGRWPANLIHDGSDEVTGLFPQANHKTGGRFDKSGDGWGTGNHAPAGYSDSGSAARFFYCAKASKRDRDEGNIHPTVKPTDLMRYLCRLVTPPGGVVLDPFMGSGSTGKAALREGFRFIGIERDPDYIEIARARIAAAVIDDEPGNDNTPDLFGDAAHG